MSQPIARFETYLSEIADATGKLLTLNNEVGTKESVAGMFHTLMMEGKHEDLDRIFQRYFPRYYSTPIVFEITDN